VRPFDVAAGFAALAALAFVVSPLWRDATTWASSIEARASWFMLEVDRVTLARYHELPLWNPYACAGVPQLASPQSSTLSPLTALVVLFGTPLGYRLGVTVGLLTALLSLRAWARTLGLSRAASTLAGAGFAVCGAFALHLGAGQWSWLAFALHPLLLRSLTLARAGRRAHLAWGALAFALIVFQSPTDPTRLAVVVVALYAIFLGLWGPGAAHGARLMSLARALGAAAVMLALGAALAAVRLLPLRALLASHPRAVADRDLTSPGELVTTYATRYADRALGHHVHSFSDLGNYFGWAGLALALAGLVFVLARRRAFAPVAAGALACVLLQLGGGPPLPWGLLKLLPATGGLEAPSRFTLLAGMFLCVLVGVAVDAWATPALERGASPPARRALAIGVLVLVGAYLVDATSWNRLPFATTLGAPPPVDEPREDFRLLPGDANRMLLYPRMNAGTLRCRVEPPPAISPRIRPILATEEYLEDPGAGTVWRVSWSPNRIQLHVDVQRQTVVVVNQNFDAGWTATGGALVPSFEGGLLAAEVLPGERVVTFSYRPRSLVVGGVVSLLALLAAAALVVSGRRRDARDLR
jgi:hypothetical protein